jgi:hypothetical protein
MRCHSMAAYFVYWWNMERKAGFDEGFKEQETYLIKK